MPSVVVESSPPLSKTTAFIFTSTARSPPPSHIRITCVPVHYRWRRAAWQAVASSSSLRCPGAGTGPSWPYNSGRDGLEGGERGLGGAVGVAQAVVLRPAAVVADLEPESGLHELVEPEDLVECGEVGCLHALGHGFGAPARLGDV